MMHHLALPLLLLSSLTSAHFQIINPVPRGYDEDSLAQFPCGGQNTPSPNRTIFPLAGGPIQLNMEHDRSAVQVLMGLGDSPGGNFNITLEPIFLEEGIGKFCLGDVMIPANLGLKDGMNATIQVVTNGDPQGGLYNCADITLSTSAPAGQCNNGTGVQAAKYTGANTNANMTDNASSSSPSASSGATMTATGSAGAATVSHSSAGRRMMMVGVGGGSGTAAAAAAVWGGVMMLGGLVAVVL